MKIEIFTRKDCILCIDFKRVIDDREVSPNVGFEIIDLTKNNNTDFYQNVSRFYYYTNLAFTKFGKDVETLPSMVVTKDNGEITFFCGEDAISHFVLLSNQKKVLKDGQTS